jgi:hypothetical protein
MHHYKADLAAFVHAAQSNDAERCTARSRRHAGAIVRTRRNLKLNPARDHIE